MAYALGYMIAVLTLSALLVLGAYAVRSSVPSIFGSTIVINDSLPFGDFNIMKVMR